MLTDLDRLNDFWKDFQTVSKMEDVTEPSVKVKGTIFEERVALLINKHFNCTSIRWGQKNLRQCRGRNKHQFDIEFTIGEARFICECKYTERDERQAWATIKDGLSKFLFAVVQRLEHLKRIEVKNTFLILITNVPLNRSIINDCIFNNVIFINPSQPPIPLVLKLFADAPGTFSEFNNREIYDKLKLYSNHLFTYKNVLSNTDNVDPLLANDYFSFIKNNQLIVY
jgi:hypothetical protein